MADTEVPVSPELLAQILSSVTPDAVLVGGQALAFWVGHYDVPLRPERLVGAISDDADFLGSRADLVGIAKGVRGSLEFTSPKVISALVGQVKIPVAAGQFVNVDVLHRLVGIEAGKVRERASEATLGGVQFLVMHPLDVLQSRVENLAKLKDKQNPEGVEQTRLSVLVARSYISEIAGFPDDGQKHARKMIEHVVNIAKSSAGRRAAREFGIDFRGAIPEAVIVSDEFRTNRWPRLLQELATAAGEPTMPADCPESPKGPSFRM